MSSIGVKEVGRDRPRHGIGTRRVATPEGTFREELHGLRGLALTLVVLFHLFGNGRVSGGIDVFLAISGFLFTGSLLRRASGGNGWISYIDHIGRLGKRLLPPIIPVLVAVALGAYAFLPASRWVQVVHELKATILYYENWELISSQLDYDAAGASTSPLQHFWSLSVQGQFYIAAPLVIVAVVLIARWRGVSSKRLLLGVLIAITVASLAYSEYKVGVDQPVAYFHTGARVWEFSLGGIAALVLPHLRLNRQQRAVAGWVGAVMIVSCGFLFDGGTQFPGVSALWPVFGMIFVLVGGVSGSPFGVDRILLTRPLTFLADISYSLYLWHWPILIFFLAAFGREQLGVRGATAILAASVVLAWFSRRFIEGPIANRRLYTGRRRQFIGAVATLAIVGVSTGALASELSEREDQLIADSLLATGEHAGAAALFSSAEIDYHMQDSEAIVPNLSILGKDLPAVYNQGCVQSWRAGFTEVLTCENDVENPTRRVIMTGGSHIGQWWPAMKLIAAEHNWDLVLMEKGGCHLTTDQENRDELGFDDSCREWNRAAMDSILENPPDAVFTLGSTTKGGREHTPSGMSGVLEQLSESGITALAVRDTPRLAESAEECLTREGLDPRVCGQGRLDSLASDYPLLDEVGDGVAAIDMTSAFCTDDFCPAIVGGVIVMRDEHHVSATYMGSVAPFLERELQQQAPQLFGSP